VKRGDTPTGWAFAAPSAVLFVLFLVVHHSAASVCTSDGADPQTFLRLLFFQRQIIKGIATTGFGGQ
jgi:hypothetical protein